MRLEGLASIRFRYLSIRYPSIQFLSIQFLSIQYSVQPVASIFSSIRYLMDCICVVQYLSSGLCSSYIANYGIQSHGAPDLPSPDLPSWQLTICEYKTPTKGYISLVALLNQTKAIYPFRYWWQRG